MVAMRFSESEYSTIKSKAEKAKMNFTEFITTAALGKSFTIIEGLAEVQREQKAIGRNLNQLTTLCNMGKIQCLDMSEIKQGFGRITERLGELIERCS